MTDLGRVLRTVRHIRPRQLLAQLEFAARGLAAPVHLTGDAPRVAIQGATLAAFLPAPEHARWDGDRRVRVVGAEVAFPAKVDWAHTDAGPLWAYHLHQFDYLRHENVLPASRVNLVFDWIEHHRAGTGWDPHPICLRVLCWTKLLLTPGALELAASQRDVLCLSIASQIETLSRNIENRLQANHLLSNLLGIVWGGVLFEGAIADRWLTHATALEREIERQILPDGGHEERSPMYHSLLLENLLDLLNLVRSTDKALPPGLESTLSRAAARMLEALRAWTHPDGEIALLSDSAFGIAQPPGALAAYAAQLDVTPSDDPGERPETLVLRDSGTARLAGGPFVAIACLAGPAPAHQPGHAHCDALSFELSVLGERVVTDTGVLEYVAGPARTRCRSTLAHATIEVGGAEQAEIWSAHRVGGRPVVKLGTVDVGPEGAIVEGSCAGWSTRGTVHRRRFSLQDEGAVFEIEDAMEGEPKSVRFALPLAPGLHATLESSGSGQRALVRLENGQLLRIHLPEGVSWRVESAPYHPRFGSSLDRECILGQAENFRRGGWRFELD